LDLQTLLEELENLIDPQVLSLEELEVSSKLGSFDTQAILEVNGTANATLTLPLAHTRAGISRLLSQARRVAETPSKTRDSCARQYPRWIYLGSRSGYFSFGGDKHYLYTHGIELE
jgi:hypothetical protein